jgi:hypothetical protein
LEGSAQVETSNRFLQAKLACISRKASAKAAQKGRSVDEEEHGLFGEVTTFRSIKKELAVGERDRLQPLV